MQSNGVIRSLPERLFEQIITISGTMNLTLGEGWELFPGRRVMAIPESEESVADVIEAYRRRRERMIPLLLGGLAVVLLVVGGFMIVLWLTGDTPPSLPGFLASDTPTPTQTVTPRPPTITPTITETLQPTDTPTPEGPLTYVVEEGESLWSIAEKFGVDMQILMYVNNIAVADEIFVGQELLIPEQGAELPTETPLPATLLPGQLIVYRVKPGDTLESIAALFNSTAEAIAEENGIEDPNAIGIGQELIVPVNIATPTATTET
jgi:LysM repeat protein